MKKTGIYICLFLLALCLIGCTDQKAVQENRLVEEDMEEERDGYITVGFAEVGSESDWRRAHTQSFKEAFAFENGYYLLFEDAQQKQENQLKAIRNFILQEVDYIILDPIVETGWDAVLQEAKDAGIPVILADRFAKVKNEELYTCWVGSDFYKEGSRAGEWLADYLEHRSRNREQINIVTLQGTIGSSAQIGRTEGFESILEKHDNWSMLEAQSGDFVQAKGQEVMEDMLKSHQDIDVVICENDNMAFGAIDAIKASGRDCGPDGDIIIISFDACRAALQAMKDGDINADFECNPLLGPLVSEIIQNLEDGETVEKVRYVEETYFDTSMDLDMLLEDRAY